MAHDVYISYASEDKAVARDVCAALEQRGIRCWVAPRDGAGHAETTRAIKTASAVVLILSERMSLRDLEAAGNAERPIVVLATSREGVLFARVGAGRLRIAHLVLDLAGYVSSALPLDRRDLRELVDIVVAILPPRVPDAYQAPGDRAERVIQFAAHLVDRYDWLLGSSEKHRLDSLVQEARRAQARRDPAVFDQHVRQLEEALKVLPRGVWTFLELRGAIDGRVQPRDVAVAARLTRELEQVENAYKNKDSDAQGVHRAFEQGLVRAITELEGQRVSLCRQCQAELTPGQRHCSNGHDTWRLADADTPRGAMAEETSHPEDRLPTGPRKAARFGETIEGEEGGTPERPRGASEEEHDVPRGAMAEKTSAADPVHFTVTTPQAVPPGATFVIDVWAHLGTSVKRVLRRARQMIGAPILSRSEGPTEVVRNTHIAVLVEVHDLDVKGWKDLYWVGEPANASFAVAIPPGTEAREFSGHATFLVRGLPIAGIPFQIVVSRTKAKGKSVSVRGRPYRTAFACYASPDRSGVMARVQGMRAAVPGLDVFTDVLELRMADNWERRVRREIRTRDVFYLFWSTAAKASSEVEKEWRFARKSRGDGFITPVPLVSPEVAPPPGELAHKHFYDPTLVYT